MDRHRKPLVRAACAAAVAALLTACGPAGDDEGTDAADTGRGPQVVVPGRPGEANSTLSSDQAAKARPDDRPNSADIAYMRMMTIHHRQALVMTDLADGHARDKRVRGIAERIAAAQKPEIASMEAWLEKNAGSGRGGAHDHSAMPGMATADQLAKLRAARGEEFDALFLKLMITHHQGAITMAGDVTADGNDPYVEETATDVIASQTSEIARMRAMV